MGHNCRWRGTCGAEGALTAAELAGLVALVLARGAPAETPWQDGAGTARKLLALAGLRPARRASPLIPPSLTPHTPGDQRPVRLPRLLEVDEKGPRVVQDVQREALSFLPPAGCRRLGPPGSPLGALGKDEVYVGRGSVPHGLPRSPWGNAHKVRGLGRASAISAFEADLWASEGLLRALPSLAGQVLVCHCREAQDCHADAIIKVAKRWASFGLRGDEQPLALVPPAPCSSGAGEVHTEDSEELEEVGEHSEAPTAERILQASLAHRQVEALEEDTEPDADMPRKHLCRSWAGQETGYRPRSVLEGIESLAKLPTAIMAGERR